MKTSFNLQVLISFFLLILVLSCTDELERDVDTVDADQPYTVQVTKERSFYQAQKAQERLLKMDVDAYLVATQDSIERAWYNVMSGAFADSLSSANYIESLDSLYNLKDCSIVDTRNLTDDYSIIEPKDVKKYKVEENKRIEANTPSVPASVLDVAGKFPDNNTFYLKRINILNLDEAKSLSEVPDYLNMDMPRGITLWKLSKFCNVISEVQYQDNLFDDNVTLSVMKVNDDYELDTDLLFEQYAVEKPAKNAETYALTLEFSQDILNTGNYDNEHIKEIEVGAFRKLIGYKVGLTTRKGVYRSYFVLADEKGEYLIFAQSVEKTESEMKEILAEVGKSDGLNDYDEFYNSFYVLPDHPIDEDIFLGYSIDKLGWSYAKEKGYTNWSKAMVGHWNVNGYFWNTKKGFWTLGLFDLLTPSSQGHIYGTLYSGHKSRGKKATDVYGVQGYFVAQRSYWSSSLELNFGIGRHVFAIDSEKLDDEDMLIRAERMQFKRGGYKELIVDKLPDKEESQEL